VSKSLGEVLPKQQARVRNLIDMYRSIGPAGIFASVMMEQSLQRADKAIMSGDFVAMIAAYKELQEYK
jgi:hypothetical protein